MKLSRIRTAILMSTSLIGLAVTFQLLSLIAFAQSGPIFTAVDDSFSIHGSGSLPVTANDVLNGHNPSVNWITLPSHGTIQSGVYIPNFGYTGPDSITYNLCQGVTCSNVANVSITVTNAAPYISGKFAYIPSNGSRCINVFEGAYDFEGDLFSDVEFLTFPTNGYINGEGCGKRYVANYNYSGFDSFTYRLCDNLGACSGPVQTSVFVDSAEGMNLGYSCPIVGNPVNVTNGNMWIEHSDYLLPGHGENIEIKRFYNSQNPFSGMFGNGWTTKYEQSLQFFGSSFQDRLIRLNMPDGKAVWFARHSTSEPFRSMTSEARGQLVRNGNGSYTMTLTGGRSQNFDVNGRLTSQKDKNGNETTITYTNGLITAITDSYGRTLTFTLNTSGKVERISDATGTIADYDYFSGTNYLKTVTFADGSQYKFEYDSTSAPGRTLLKTVKDALDYVVETHNYDSAGRATTSSIHGGKELYELNYTNWTASVPYTIVTHRKNIGDPAIETKYYFDTGKGKNLITKSEGLCNCGGSNSQTTTFSYTVELNILKKIETIIDGEQFRETSYTYDVDQNLTKLKDFIGTQSFTYNSFGEVLTATDRMGGVTTNVYNTTGDLLTSTDALGKVTTLTYPSTNNKGLPDTIKDARNYVTKFKWFPTSGLLQEIEDPYAKKTNFTYDPRGRIDTVTNTYGHVTDYNYFDDTQRKVEMIYPNLDKVTYKFDVRRLLESVTNERGKITNYEFDPQYRLKKVTDPLGNAKEYGYDDMSNLISFNDQLATPLDNITNYHYDDFNRLKEIEYPAATSGATRLKEKFDYDKLGRIKKVTDTANRDTVYVYDDMNQKITITNAELEATELTYNDRLQMTTVKDALNQVYTFAYDTFGRVLSQTRAGGTMTFEYDEVGNRKKRTDYMGRVTNYEYDQLNRLKKIRYGDAVTPGTPVPEATYGYDDISRMTSAMNDSGTVTFGYDNRNRITSTTDVFGQVLTYQYERTSSVNQKRLLLNGSLYATYNYDNGERLLNIVNASDSATIGFTYYEDGAVKKRTYPNGVTTDYLYDNMRRRTRLTDTGPSGALFDRQYGYNNANQITQITELSGTRMFGYDDVNRLETVTGSATENYVFDDLGNRTSSHLASSYGYQLGQFNRLTSAVTPSQTVTYGFDANGNTIIKAEGKELWKYKWDLDNRMVEASTRKEKVQYKYDALGRRVSRSQGNGKDRTKFTYDGNDVLIDDADGTLTKYLNGDGIDDTLRSTTGSSTSYFLADHLGSTNGLTNSSGVVTASNSYDSFGNPTNLTFPTRYQFTGREFDNFSGLQHSRARLYDPKIGRFVSEDPIGFRGGDVNLYGYVWNDPVNYYDPSGLYPFRLPANPGPNGENLPSGWKRDPRHRGSERWVSPDGSEGLDFDPATPGKPGMGGRDHWHPLKPKPNGSGLERDKEGGRKGGHYLPGDEVELNPTFCPLPQRSLSQPSMEEIRLQIEAANHMEVFWTKVLVGSAAGGVVYFAPAAIPALVRVLSQSAPRLEPALNY